MVVARNRRDVLLAAHTLRLHGVCFMPYVEQVRVAAVASVGCKLRLLAPMGAAFTLCTGSPSSPPSLKRYSAPHPFSSQVLRLLYECIVHKGKRDPTAQNTREHHAAVAYLAIEDRVKCFQNVLPGLLDQVGYEVAMSGVSMA